MFVIPSCCRIRGTFVWVHTESVSMILSGKLLGDGCYCWIFNVLWQDLGEDLWGGWFLSGGECESLISQYFRTWICRFDFDYFWCYVEVIGVELGIDQRFKTWGFWSLVQSACSICLFPYCFITFVLILSCHLRVGVLWDGRLCVRVCGSTTMHCQF